MDSEGFQQFLGLTPAEQRQVMQPLSESQIKELSKAINQRRRDMYEVSGGHPKYGNLRRRFYKDEIAHIMETTRNFGVRVAFQFLLFYGLRIGELSHIEHEPKQNLLKIYQPKNDRTEWLPIHGKTQEITKYVDEVRDYSKDYLRNCFTSIREDTGMTYVYDQASDGRDLYQFVTHSFRKTAITMFAKNVDQELKVKEFARHKDGDTTMRYFDYDYRQMKEDLEKTFSDLYQVI